MGIVSASLAIVFTPLAFVSGSLDIANDTETIVLALMEIVFAPLAIVFETLAIVFDSLAHANALLEAGAEALAIVFVM